MSKYMRRDERGRWFDLFRIQISKGHKGQRYLASGHATEMLRAGASAREAVRGGLNAAGLWPFNERML